MSSELLHFVLPSASSALELTFFVLIIGSLLVSLLSAELVGREATWERHWKGSARQGALDLQHGSLSELNHALASLPERIVDNMPGLLLIVGLLGTFLGLGLALDKASAVLQGSGDSLNAMNDSLTQLTGMMKDLGSKFKTSTWGIFAFITLKLWEASRWSAQSRRSDWCVRQMKIEIELERRDLRADNERRDLQRRDTLERVGERLVQAMHQQSALLADEFRQLRGQQAQLAQDSQEQSDAFNKRLMTLSAASNRLLSSLDQRAEASVGQFDALKAFNARLLSLAQERDDHLLTQVTEFINQIRESNLSLASLDQRSESVARQLDALLHGTRDITLRLDALNSSSAAQETHLESTLEGIASVNSALHAASRRKRPEPAEPGEVA